MRPLTTLAVWLILATSGLAQITIEAPPGPIAAVENVQVFVHGIDADDLPTAIAKHYPRTGTTFVPAKTWGNDPFIYFSAPPGKYLIWVACNGEYAEAEIVVGEPQPNPTPGPTPDPLPLPGQLSYLILFESSNRPPSEALTLFRLREYATTRGAALKLRMEDKDLVDGLTRKPPAWLVPWSQALNTSRVQVPAILVGSTRNGVLSVVDVKPLGTSAEAIALIQKWGGK